jgi:hypothetical protein
MHNVLFYRNPISRQFRAVCSCGWTLTDADEKWVQERVAVHDLNQEDKDEITNHTFQSRWRA